MLKHMLLALSAIALLGSVALAEEKAEPAVPSLLDSVTQGKPLVDVRLRYELGDDDAKEDSEAFTLRTRVGYETKAWHGLSALIELEDVSVLNDEHDYNMANLDADSTNKTSIADVEGAELNQAYLAYKAGTTVAKLGRQRLILDDSRFVGNVGWRQNEQTFDAATLQNTCMGHLNATYGYVDHVYRIFGQDNGAEPAGSAANAAEFESDSHLINLRCTKHTGFVPTLYAYLLDLGDAKVGAMNSSDTYGANIALSRKAGGTALSGNLAYAQQADNSASYEGSDFSVPYYRADATVGYSMVKIGAGYEVLGSDDGEAAFQTPLATLHKFNGWADQFTTTPNAGLEDFFASLSVTCPISGAELLLVWHDFNADEGSLDYGDEWDLQVSRKFGPTTLLAKLAMYNASGDAGNPKGSDLERITLDASVVF